MIKEHMVKILTEYEITYVLSGWGLLENHVVLGIKEVKDV